MVSLKVHPTDSTVLTPPPPIKQTTRRMSALEQDLETARRAALGDLTNGGKRETRSKGGSLGLRSRDANVPVTHERQSVKELRETTKQSQQWTVRVWWSRTRLRSQSIQTAFSQAGSQTFF